MVDWVTPRMACRRLDPERIEDRRYHVDDVRVLRADLAARLDTLGPTDDERVADAAPVGLALPATERRVAGIRPAPREVIENLRPADLVDGRQVLFDRVRDVVEKLALVHRSVRPALRAGTVVRDQHDQRVLVLAEVLEELNELADVVVGVGQEARRRPPSSARRPGVRRPGASPNPAHPDRGGRASAFVGMIPSSFCLSKTCLR